MRVYIPQKYYIGANIQQYFHQKGKGGGVKCPPLFETCLPSPPLLIQTSLHTCLKIYQYSVFLGHESKIAIPPPTPPYSVSGDNTVLQCV